MNPGDPPGEAPARPAPRTTGGHRLVRTAGLISAATMLSRLLGLVREQLFAVLLGATRFADAFIVGFRIPNLLRDLFAEGALSQAFVPTFKSSLKRDGTQAAYRLGNRVAGTLLALIATVTILAAAAAPEIVHVMAGDFLDTPGKFDLTVLLTRIMMPFLAMVSLAAVAMGMLNAQNRYATPALAPATFNLVCIAIGLLLWLLGLDGTKVVIGWALATLLGGAAQLFIQIPALWRQGWRPRLGLDLGLRDPDVRRVAKLMVPAIAGLAAVQVNVFVNTIFATQEAGAVAWLNYAFRFLQ
ncbi:MAG TPA: murein biosynthesis integral membrane protein MurJ, partial [Kofleriaceae bacterium]|nr:murein biosynthesis integral membrane protein MurJ [Kofleriaceae bacterium]